jgi:hypothetical protein
MSDNFEDYRRMAEYCAKMSRTASTIELRASWLGLAAKWLALLPKREMSESERFDAMVRDMGTGQKDSNSSH